MQNPDLQANDLNLYKYKNKLSDEQKQLLKLLHVLHLIAFAASIGTGIFTTWIIFHKRPQIGYFIFLFLNIIEKPVSFMYIFFPNQSISHFCKIGVFFCWGINWIYAIICFVVLFILAGSYNECGLFEKYPLANAFGNFIGALFGEQYHSLPMHFKVFIYLSSAVLILYILTVMLFYFARAHIAKNIRSKAHDEMHKILIMV